MQITKKNVVTDGEWNEGTFKGTLYSGPELDGFWVECSFTCESKEGYIKNVSFDKWETGYIDSENNECQLSESLNDLLSDKVIHYIKNNPI